MNLQVLLTDGLWGGVFSLAMAVVFSTPYGALMPSFCCGFVARGVRDALVGWGMGPILATAVAAAAVVITATALVRRSGVSPIVMLSALVPLGAAGPFFNAIVDFLQLSSAKGAAFNTVPVKLIVDLSRVFTTFLAIAVGAWVGIALSRMTRLE